MGDHAVPLHLKILPSMPTAQRLLGPVPPTAYIAAIVASHETLAQVLPLKRMIVPSPPTAQTSLAPLPQTPRRWRGICGVMGVETSLKAVPLKCIERPYSPTAHTSFGP